MKNIFIYSDFFSNRKKYIFNAIFNEFLGLNVKYLNTVDDFANCNFPKISYCQKKIDNSLNIYNSNQIESNDFYKTIFPTKLQIEINDIDESFDFFAFCFFMLSRAEEYKSINIDKHKRFLSSSSLSYKNNMLDVPIVDILVDKLKQKLINLYPNLDFNIEKWKPILTFDIDIAWKYRTKPLLRQIGAFAKDIFNADTENIYKRIKTLSNKSLDPYEIYDFIYEIKQSSNIETIFFFHVNSFGKYDKAVNTKSTDFNKLVKKISQFSTIGIHPSYKNGQNTIKLIKEKNILENILGYKIENSRHHYLKLHFPNTIRVLEDSGIKNDYTMGFADNINWRTGTTKAFNVFDIENNKTLNLKTHPISFMDGTLKDYLNLDTQTSIKTIKNIMQQTKKYNGNFISIWHNDTICNQNSKSIEWKNEVFIPMINEIKNQLQND